MLDVFLLIDALIVAGLSVLALMALIGGGYRRKLNRNFAFFNTLAGTWIIANHISNDIGVSPSTAVVANYFVFAASFGAMLLMLKVLAYVIYGYLPKLIKKSEPILWVVFLFSGTPLTAVDVEKQERVYGVVFGPFIAVYGIFLIAMLITIVWMLNFSKTAKFNRRTLRTIRLAVSLALPLVVTLNFILPSATGLFYLTEIGVFPILLVVGAFYESIIRHQLFDIKLTVVRTLAYVMSLIVLAALYYLLAYIVSVFVFRGNVSSSFSMNPLNIFLAIVLAFIFQPIKSFFDKATDRIFFRDRYNSDEFYARFSEVLTSTTDLRTLLQRAAIEVGTTLKAEQAFFFVQYHETRRITAGTSHHTDFPLKDVRDINEYIGSSGAEVIVRDILPTDFHLKRILTSHKIAILMPLVRHKEVLGYLCLGEQRASGYTSHDIKVLNTISDELVIAIQNSLSVQEVRDINTNLEQRIEAATAELRTSNARLKRLDAAKDEFLSMASHQLRTPLTSVKGYLSMILDGDMGKLTPMQKQVLEEAFSSSERMVHLIHDFLNVSRLQTGKFMLELSDVRLDTLVEQEVKSLESVALSHSMTLDFVNKAGEVTMHLDDTKMRQVVMNYIDNAIYYSHPDTTITISLEKTSDEIILKVKDTGIGVPKSEQEHLFGKFYRATNARKQRPDGTGVGIYLAKRVVTALGGDIVFESKEGKGSTFGFRLPLKQDDSFLEDKTKQLEDQPT